MTKSSKMNKISSLIQIFSLILILLIAAKQEKNQFENSLISFEEALRSNISILQEKTIPFNLATELIFNELNSAEIIDSSSSEKLVNELNKRFNGKIKLFLLDHKFKPIESLNLNKKEYSDVSRFIKEYCLLNERIFPADKAFFSDFLAKYFNNSPDRHSLPNFINSSEVRYMGIPGVFIVGSIIDPKYQKELNHTMCNLKEPKKFRQAFRGAIFAFIPTKEIQSSDWVSININSKKNGPPIFLGTQREILKNEKLPDELKNNFLKLSDEKQQGTFIGESLGFTYCQTELSSQDGKPEFAIRAMKKPTYKISGRLFLFAIMLIISGFFIVRIQSLKKTHEKGWKQRISRKFIFLSLISCVLPLSGFLYQTMARLDTLEKQQKNKIYSQLESKFSSIESEQKNSMSDYILKIQTYQNYLNSLNPFSQAEARKKIRSLKGLMLSKIYVSERNGKNFFISKNDDLDEKESNIGRMNAFGIILDYIHKNLKFSKHKAGKEKKFNKSDLYIESATDALGNGTLLQLAVKRDLLLPFKMIHGSVWLYSHFQVDKTGTPLRHFLYVLRSDPFLVKKIDRLQKNEAQSNTFPKMFFMSKQYAITEDMAPTELETQPAMIQMLKFINRAGGTQRREIKIGNKTYYCLGRELKGLNWIGLAMMPKNPEGNFTKIGILPILTVFLPVMIIILIAFYFNIIYLTPVQKMQQSVEQFTLDNYTQKLLVESNDEIGELSKSFNEMATSLKEKEFLSRFLSDIAKSAISGENQTRATRINATILFSDIRGFTTLSEQNPPEVIVEMLNSYMTSMEEAIEANGGNIEKFIGDAIMAVFLPRLGVENPAVRACKAALEMNKNLAVLNQKRALNNQFQINSGVGISTGTVLMGVLGNLEGRRDYTVTGPAVNAAAQMEKLSKYANISKIVVCSSTATKLAKKGLKTQFLDCEENKLGGKELLI